MSGDSQCLSVGRSRLVYRGSIDLPHLSDVESPFFGESICRIIIRDSLGGPFVMAEDSMRQFMGDDGHRNVIIIPDIQ